MGNLQGKRVLVTRASGQAGRLSAALREAGAEPVEVPLLEIVPPESYEPLDNALRHLFDYDWLILSSVNAVEVFADRVIQNEIFRGFGAVQGSRPGAVSLSEVQQQVGFPKIAVVGRATGEAVRKTGLTVTLVPEHFVAESLLSELSQLPLEGRKFLLPRAESARDLLPEALREAGARVDVVSAYRNQMPEGSIGLLRQALEQGIDAATFTSSSSAEHLAEAVGAVGLAWPLPGVAAISIGPVTSARLRELDWEPSAEADPHDIPGLVGALRGYFSGTEGNS